MAIMHSLRFFSGPQFTIDYNASLLDRASNFLDSVEMLR